MNFVTWELRTCFQRVCPYCNELPSPLIEYPLTLPGASSPRVLMNTAVSGAVKALRLWRFRSYSNLVVCVEDGALRRRLGRALTGAGLL